MFIPRYTHPAKGLTDERPLLRQAGPDPHPSCSRFVHSRYRDVNQDASRLRDACLSTIGGACAALHGNLIQNLEASIGEVDELWSFIRKKQKQLQA